MKTLKTSNILRVVSFAVFLLLLTSFVGDIFDENQIELVTLKRPEHRYQFVHNETSEITGKEKIAKIPFVERDFVGFKEALAFKESQGEYTSVNTLGYLGKYQFGKSTLKDLNINVHPKSFLNDPLLQEKAFLANLQKNKWILRKEIKRFNGKWIKGIKITESGILAAAHLGGAGAVQKFLWSNGNNTMTDAYGTTIEHYLKKFSGYNLSDIQAKKKPIISFK